MNKKVMLVALFVLVLFSMLAMAVAGRSRFPFGQQSGGGSSAAGRKYADRVRQCR